MAAINETAKYWRCVGNDESRLKLGAVYELLDNGIPNGCKTFPPTEPNYERSRFEPWTPCVGDLIGINGEQQDPRYTGIVIGVTENHVEVRFNIGDPSLTPCLHRAPSLPEEDVCVGEVKERRTRESRA